ncbi:PilT/PilU family type 4a pilus ATPase [Parvivirga hydrogeniphila]|uniref:PilT/PilU family type 4a pilus ATPase n=1 Tax=Parvivirga hydrogeniphila TaxID=2939460 RepID=UPI002B266F11|nr:PilT/PilU family type 4a pilus ATPase [Parvivirga hydrogeniphila]
MSETIVLVVHDDPAFSQRFETALRSVVPDAVVRSLPSAMRALAVAKQQRPAVIIADGDLAGMDGFTMTQELKADDELAAIPVIIVSNNPTEATALRARQVGAAAHLPSSVDSATLVQKVFSLMASETGATGGQTETSSQSPEAQAALSGQAVGYGVPQPLPEDSPFARPQPDSGAPSQPVEQPAAAPQVTVGPTAPGADVPHVDDLLHLMLDMGGSDLHITVGSPPGIRVRGELVPAEGYKSLSPRDTQAMILTLLSEEQRKRFETELELDFAYSIPGVSRFRANVFQQRGSMGAVFRVIPLTIPTLDSLGLPRVCKFLAERPRGLVLVTGPTGSGKSTTLAAMIDHINETRRVHIITLEDPIEFVHRNKKAYVNQREIGEDTHSFASALKRVLRQDPDVILVGEMRDLETISAAITAAETGHLVLATLHTTGGPATVDRIIDVFPPHQQQQVRMQLSGTLEGVLSQVLLRSADGKTRVLAMEIMLGIPAISNLIREGKTHQMTTIIQGGAQLGMQTLDQHLKALVQAGKVTYEEAMSKAQEPRELAQMLGRKM